MDSKYNFLKPIKNTNLIRLGRDRDGGYIIDERIVKNTNYLVTFGMGPDWSFELDYIKKNPDVKIFMYFLLSKYIYNSWKILSILILYILLLDLIKLLKSCSVFMMLFHICY